MTPEQLFEAWALTEGGWSLKPKQDPYLEMHWDDEQKAFLAGYAAAKPRWIAVSEPDELMMQIDGIAHFLVPVYDNSLNYHYWDIVTGHISDTGELISQVNDEPSGWDIEHAAYYMMVHPLPPLSTPPTQ